MLQIKRKNKKINVYINLKKKNVWKRLIKIECKEN
jgi:hypothetical protein